MDAIEPAPRSRSGRTNCQKDQQPSRPRAAKNQASWYCSSWRGLQSGASTPDDSRLITPETTPPSIPTNPATPRAAYRQSRHQYKAFGLSIRRTAMSTAQKSNKENKKPKADKNQSLSLIHISEPTRLGMISYAVFCLK